MKVTTDAVQVLGGYGYTRDYPAERYMREAKVTQIFEGTNQIQRLVIGRQLLKQLDTSDLSERAVLERRSVLTSRRRGVGREAARARCRAGDRVGVGTGRGHGAAVLAQGASALIVDLPSSAGSEVAAELGERVRFAGGRTR